MSAAATLRIEDPGAVMVVSVEGEVDLSNADALLDGVMGSVVNDCHALVLDLSGVRYLDSTGVSRLAEIVRVLEQRRQTVVVVVRRGSALSRLFAITHLDQAVGVAETVDEARELANASEGLA